jgi:hypothetical protein
VTPKWAFQNLEENMLKFVSVQHEYGLPGVMEKAGLQM